MKTLKYILVIVIFIIIGFVLYKPFFEFSIDMIKHEKVEFFINGITSQFTAQLVFAMIIGFIPILYLIIQKLTKISFLFDGFYVLLFILLFGFLTAVFRGVFIFQELMFLTNFKFPDDVKPSYSIARLYFEYYLFFGFILGALISFLLLRLKSKMHNKI